MKIYKEGIESYTPWNGAKDTYDKICEADKVDDLETMLEAFYPDGMSETELNDLLWFEPETVFEWLGIECDEDE